MAIGKRLAESIHYLNEDAFRGLPPARPRTVAEDWEYPPVRLPDGTDLSSEQVRGLVEWYWRSGQAREDLGAFREED